MELLQDQLMENGLLASLVTQIVIATTDMSPEEWKEMLSGSNSPHLAVQGYCDTALIGKSMFCDYVWKIWTVPLTQTMVYLVIFSLTTIFWAFIFGVMQF